MKRIFIFFFFISAFVSATLLSAKQEGNSKLWLKANDSYSLGDYKDALEAYKMIEESGEVSYKLYYNMANSYYKLQDDGLAILYYERALRLNPSNDDIKINLEIARLKTLDKIEVLPEFILTSWTKKFRNMFSSDSWAYTSLILFVLVALLFLLYRYGTSIVVRKLSFIGALLCAFFAIFAVTFSLTLRSGAVAEDSAIILLPVSNVKSAPNSTGNNLFILHEGTKINIIENLGQWSRIELSDGRQGWVESGDFEII